ncbi:MAG: hypothetical protein ACLVB5_06495 [Christensenellales bacterium]
METSGALKLDGVPAFNTASAQLYPFRRSGALPRKSGWKLNGKQRSPKRGTKKDGSFVRQVEIAGRGRRREVVVVTAGEDTAPFTISL